MTRIRELHVDDPVRNRHGKFSAEATPFPAIWLIDIT